MIRCGIRIAARGTCCCQMEEQNPADFAYRVRIGLHRVTGADNELGYRLRNMGALIAHNAIVTCLDRTVALNGDYRMRGDFRRYRDCGKRLQERIAG